MLGALTSSVAFALRRLGLAGTWESFHRGFRYADYVIAAALVALIAAAAVRGRLRRSTAPRSEARPSRRSQSGGLRILLGLQIKPYRDASAETTLHRCRRL